MGSLDELSFSKKFFYIQVDADGYVIDCNNLFSLVYGDIVSGSICEILELNDVKEIIRVAESLKVEKNNPVVIRVNTKRKDKVYMSMWKIVYVKDCFIALGNEFEDALIFALNHSIRGNSATIEGLMQFRNEIDNNDLLDLIDIKVKDLNNEIARIMYYLSTK